MFVGGPLNLGADGRSSLQSSSVGGDSQLTYSDACHNMRVQASLWQASDSNEPDISSSSSSHGGKDLHAPFASHHIPFNFLSMLSSQARGRR
jgi:hypothetical protein